jgi:Tol biopolymer transport system component
VGLVWWGRERPWTRRIATMLLIVLCAAGSGGAVTLEVTDEPVDCAVMKVKEAVGDALTLAARTHGRITVALRDRPLAKVAQQIAEAGAFALVTVGDSHTIVRPDRERPCRIERLLEAGLVQEALLAATEWVANAPEAEVDEAAPWLAEALLASGRAAEATDVLAPLALTAPGGPPRTIVANLLEVAEGRDSPEVRLALGEAYLEWEAPFAALVHLRAGLAQAPDDADLLFRYAVACEAAQLLVRAQAAWAAYLKVDGTSDRAWLVRMGCVPVRTEHLAGTPGPDQTPRWSGDGKLIAFQALRGQGGDITVVDAYSGELQTVAARGNFRWFDWSWATGELVLSQVRADAPRVWELFSATPFGEGEPLRLPLSVPGTQPRWTPDGQRVLFSSEPDLYTAAADGSDVQKLPLAGEPGKHLYHPAISPDGKFVAFSVGSWEQKGTAYELRVAPIDGSEPARKVTSVTVQERIGEVHADFSPDGRLLAFSSDLNDPGHSFDTYVVDAAGAHAEVGLLPGTGRASWSPDGMRIAYDRWTDEANLEVFVSTLGGLRDRAAAIAGAGAPAQP